MRRTLLALSVLGPLALAGIATADPAPPTEGTLTVHAFTGREILPVNHADIAVTPCDTTEPIVTLISGADGRATIALPTGCYDVGVATVPVGCGLRTDTPVQVSVTPGTESRADFRFGCA
ncbi:hypothetical protein [Nocardia lasii]|uniref:Uncharacterized protein n=1 Tax=Nocardia lasii TaxID=1616107 RepID=A0ABW1JUQ2_9NOCA